tara:strand:+ start:56 stop:286 length:231 start_codon:yes stop_codon:yes gene_type:complete
MSLTNAHICGAAKTTNAPRHLRMSQRKKTTPALIGPTDNWVRHVQVLLTAATACASVMPTLARGNVRNIAQAIPTV